MTDRMYGIPQLLVAEQKLIDAALRVDDTWDGEQRDALEELYAAASEYREAVGLTECHSG